MCTVSMQTKTAISNFTSKKFIFLSVLSNHFSPVVKDTNRGKYTIIISILLNIYCLITEIFISLLNLLNGLASLLKFDTIFLNVKCFLIILSKCISAQGFSQNYFWKYTLISDDFVYKILVKARKQRRKTIPSSPKRIRIKISSSTLLLSPSPYTYSSIRSITKPIRNIILKNKLKQYKKDIGLFFMQNILQFNSFFLLETFVESRQMELLTSATDFLTPMCFLSSLIMSCYELIYGSYYMMSDLSSISSESQTISGSQIMLQQFLWI